MTKIEEIAKAIYERRNGHGAKPWGSLSKAHQESYLGDAEAAVERMASDAPDKVFWQGWAAKRLEISRSQWLRAAKSALAGDLRDLRLRVDLAEAPPVQIVCSQEKTAAE
jgi:hypothetical protein